MLRMQGVSDVGMAPLLTKANRILQLNFITGQNEREETTQNTTVTKSAACASYKSNY
jgi:hypothetical protein